MSMSNLGGDIKFVIKIQNEERLKKLGEQIERQEDAIRTLDEAYRKGRLSQDQFFARVAPFAGNIRDLKEEMEGLAQSATKVAGAMRSGFNNPAMGFLYLSQGIEDLQYGFSAIVNNIPMLVMALGGGPGVAGAISIAAVAVNQLIKNWDELSDVFQAAWSGSAVEQLTKIRETAEEAAKAFDELAKSPTKAGAAGVKGLANVLKNGSEGLGEAFEAVFSEVTKRNRAEMAQEGRHAQNAPVAFGAPGVVPMAREGARAVQERMLQANREEAKKLIGQALLPDEKGDAARKMLEGMNLPPEIKRAVREANPEFQKEQAFFKAQHAFFKDADKAVEKDQAAKFFEAQDEFFEEADKAVKAEKDFFKAQEAFFKDAAKAIEHDREIAQRRQQLEVNRMLNRDIQAPHRKPAEMIGFGFSAWNKMQMNLLNGPEDIAKQQLKTLNDIRQILAQNPAQQAGMGAAMLGGLAVAGNPP